MNENETIDTICSLRHGATTPEEISNCPRQEAAHDLASSQGDRRGTDREVKQEQDIPPDGGYGWVCVACVFWINAHTWGINSSYGVFLSWYLSHNMFPNTSALAYAFTGGLSISCALLVAPVATYLIQTFGTRLAINIGIFFETISLVGSSFAYAEWHIFLSQGVCFGWGMGFMFVSSVGIAPQWFHRRRSVANGITAAGSGLGGLIYSLAVGAMLPRLGLSWTFRVLAILSFVVNMICGNLLRDRNKAIGSRLIAFHFPLFKRPEFLFFLGWGVLTMLGYVALLFSVANFSLSVGLSPHQGSIVSALLNLGQGLGRPFVGMFSDRFGRINIATLLSFLCGLFCLVIWIFAHNMGVICFFVVLVGTVSGTYWATVSPVLTEILGLRDLPSGLSVNWLLLVPPTTVSEAIALVMRDSSSKDSAYLPVQIFTGFMYIGGSLCIWIIRGWKVGELARAEEQRSISAVLNGSALTEKRRAETDHSGGDVEEIRHEARLAVPGLVQVPLTSDIRPWSPLTLARGMIALKRV